jgi:hypothetical protein
MSELLLPNPKRALLFQVLADTSRAYRLKPTSENAAKALTLYTNIARILRTGGFTSTLVMTALTEKDIERLARSTGPEILTPHVVLHRGDEVESIRQGRLLSQACLQFPLIDEPMIDAVTDFLEEANFNETTPQEAGAFLLNNYGKRAMAGYQ